MRYELIHPITQDSSLKQIFVNRGVSPEDIEHFLTPADSDIVSPSLLAHIGEGARMLVSHIVNKDKIFMIVDPDVDGFTSAALFINYLNSQFQGYAQNCIDYFMHDGKQHGLIESDISMIIENNYKIVVMIDSSSNDYELHKQLKEAGVDVLVLDHHEADQVSPYACVINNQLCDYPTKSLSGVGIAYKFCSYLDQFLEEKHANDFLDLVAVGLNLLG